jgi:hypothetical protein
MRRLRVLFAVLALSVVVGSHDASAGRARCENTNCGFYCITGSGEFAGYCNAPAEPTTGCIQLYGPDCASLQGAYCCTSSGGGL